jgi:hypothetical protein
MAQLIKIISSLFEHYGFLFVEALGVTSLVIIALLRPNLGSMWFNRAEKIFRNIARKRLLSVILVGVFTLTLRASVLPLLEKPEPFEDDEFSYLLAADTFASGRLTNPPHPLWEHFETYHIIQQPTYMSMYPPAQGLVLAAGKLIGGHPWFGVWISVGLMSATICWMLQAWMPASWALFGGLLVAMRIGIFSYWMNSYWGGAVAAIGGALVLGALPRIRRSTRVRDAVFLGLGLSILANSRPYEGFLLSLPVVITLLVWIFFKKILPLRISIYRILFPLSLVLLVAVVATGHYFWRVTGNPLKMPYQVNRETYGIAKHFHWQSLNPEPTYRHKAMRDQYLMERAWANNSSSKRGAVRKMITLWSFFCGPTLSLPMLLLPWVFRDRRTRFLLIAGVVAIIGLALEVWIFPHYLAPLTGLIFAMILQSMRHLGFLRFRRAPIGLFLVRATPLLLATMIILRIGAGTLQIPFAKIYMNPWVPGYGPEVSQRQLILTRLRKSGGRHLVIVKHEKDQQWHRELVYNNANIDNAEVIWARDMGADYNAVLINYFKDRDVWLAEPDLTPPRLSPYNIQTTTNLISTSNR